MRIDCPACAAAYEVPEALLAPGRPVRCTRCGQHWLPQPAPASPSPAASLAPLPEPPATDQPAAAPAAPPPGAKLARALRPPESRAPVAGTVMVAPRPPLPLKTGLPALLSQPESKPNWTAPLLAWAASLLLLGGGLATLWRYRDQVVAAWPPAGRLVQAILAAAA